MKTEVVVGARRIRSEKLIEHKYMIDLVLVKDLLRFVQDVRVVRGMG